MSDERAESDEWDDPHTDPPEVDPYIAGVFHGVLYAILLELAAVGGWFLAFEVVL